MSYKLTAFHHRYSNIQQAIAEDALFNTNNAIDVFGSEFISLSEIIQLSDITKMLMAALIEVETKNIGVICTTSRQVEVYVSLDLLERCGHHDKYDGYTLSELCDALLNCDQGECESLGYTSKAAMGNDLTPLSFTKCCEDIKQYESEFIDVFTAPDDAQTLETVSLHAAREVTQKLMSDTGYNTPIVIPEKSFSVWAGDGSGEWVPAMIFIRNDQIFNA